MDYCNECDSLLNDEFPQGKEYYYCSGCKQLINKNTGERKGVKLSDEDDPSIPICFYCEKRILKDLIQSDRRGYPYHIECYKEVCKKYGSDPVGLP